MYKRCMPTRGGSFPPRFAMASTCLHNPQAGRIRFVARWKQSFGRRGKCPIKSCENYLNNAPNPVAGRESDSAAQLSGHWRAGYALLPCC